LEHGKEPQLSSQNSPKPRSFQHALLSAFSGFVFGLFLSKLKTHHNNPDGMSPNGEAKQREDTGKPFTHLPNQIPTPSQAPERPCQCCHHKAPWSKTLVDFGMLFATTGAFIAAGIYAYIAHCQLETMKSQTTMLQQQVEGTMAAIITKQLRVNWPDKRAYLSMILDNRGRVIGTNIHSSFNIIEVSLSGDAFKNDKFPAWNFRVPEVTPSRDLPIEEGIYLDISREELKGTGHIPKAIKSQGNLLTSMALGIKLKLFVTTSSELSKVTSRALVKR
jgi:hypothetical protein